MIYLHKILPQLVMPIMVCVGLLALSVFKGHKKTGYFVLVLLYTLSTPILSDLILKQVEGEYGYPELATIEKVDAIVVLSGMMRINELDHQYEVEWGSAADRFFRAIDLFEAGKANCIVFTAGKTPYNPTQLSEGEILKREALKRGIPAENIRLSKVALNTSAEAVAVSELLGQDKRIILVTSAFHMKRAKQLFEKSGFHVWPYKVDFRTFPRTSYYLIDFLPSALALTKTELALRELLGRLYYKLIY